MTNRDLTTRVYRIDKVVYPYGSTTIYLVGFDRHAAVKYCEAHTDASKEIYYHINNSAKMCYEFINSLLGLGDNVVRFSEDYFKRFTQLHMIHKDFCYREV